MNEQKTKNKHVELEPIVLGEESLKTGNNPIIGTYKCVLIDGQYLTGNYQEEALFICPPNTKLTESNIFFNLYSTNDPLGVGDFWGQKEVNELVKKYTKKDSINYQKEEVDLLSSVKHCWTAGGYAPLNSTARSMGDDRFQHLEPEKRYAKLYFRPIEGSMYESLVKKIISKIE